MPRSRRNRLTRWLRLSLICYAALLLEGTASSQSVLLLLRNGDRVSGVLLGEEAGRLILSNAVLGKVVVPSDQIERRERMTNETLLAQTSVAATNVAKTSAATPPADLQRRLNDLLVVYVAGQISAEEYHRQRAKLIAEASSPPGQPLPLAGKPGAEPVARGQTAALARPPSPGASPKPPPKPKHWSGEAQMGTDLGLGEKQRELYSGRLRLNYARAHVRNNLDYSFTYGRTDGDLSANRMDGSMKTDYDLTRKTYLYSLAGGGYDEIRKIDSRYEVGPGVGYPLMKRTNFVLRVEGGFHYQMQNLQDGTQEEQFYYRLAQDLKWSLGTQFGFDEKLEYFPQIDTFHEYKVRVEANLRYWLRSNLSLNLTLVQLYDTMPAKGVGQSDLQLRSSLGVKF